MRGKADARSRIRAKKASKRLSVSDHTVLRAAFPYLGPPHDS